MLIVLAYGPPLVAPAMATAGLSGRTGVRAAAVVNARFLAPLDQDLILPLARRIGRVVTMEESLGLRFVPHVGGKPQRQRGVGACLAESAFPNQLVGSRPALTRAKTGPRAHPPQMAGAHLPAFRPCPSSASVGG